MTLRELARLAGVDLSTVSRALNDSPLVAEKTKRRIQALAREVGYHRNAAAASLVRKRTNTLGLIVPDISNPFFSELARVIEVAAVAEGFTTFLCNTMRLYDSEQRAIKRLREQRVDVMILCSLRSMSPAVVELIEDEYPAVFLQDVPEELGPVCSYSALDQEGMADVTRHLITQGRQHLIHLSGTSDANATSKRLQGFLDATNAAAIPYRIERTEYTYQGGYEAVLRLIEQSVITPSQQIGIVAANDLMALGALRALHEKGLSVPNDVAVVGFDDIMTASIVFPPLTTVRNPIVDVADDIMASVKKILSGDKSAAQRKMLPCHVVVRQSCGSPVTDREPIASQTALSEKAPSEGA